MKKYFLIIPALLFAALLPLTFTACSNANDSLEQMDFSDGSCGNPVETSASEKTDAATEGYVKLTAEEVKAFMEQHEDAVILDVRRESEYNSGHIPGAKLFPNEDINQETVSKLPGDKPLLVYCRTGKRSQQAAEKLLNLGFSEVYDFGGIVDWPYETE